MGDEVEVPLDALVRLPREIVPELVSMPAVAVLHVLAAAANLRSGDCYGGHGRTGTVIVNLLQTMGAAASPAEAMALLRARHASRGCHSCALLDGELEAPEQEAQAAALASQHKRGRMLQ